MHDPAHSPRSAAAPVRPAEFAGPGGAPPRHHADNPAGTWPHRHDQASRARGRRGTNLGRNLTLAVVALLVVAGLAGIGYKLAHRQHGATPPGTAQTGPAVGRQSPEKVVVDYFADINQHRYHAAWQLSGERESLAAFKAGLAGTQKDHVTILGTTGDVVSAELHALQADGSVKIFRGTYTVINGVITNPNVHQVSPSPATS